MVDRRDEWRAKWADDGGGFEPRAHIAAAVAAERERCAKLCEWLPIGTGLKGKTFAEAIRGEGVGGKMARGFRA